MNGTPPRVFVARLAGVAVFDPAGDQIGRNRDVVATWRRDGLPPRVLGFVVEIQPRRPIFLPITQVTQIEVDAIIFTGRINMRRFAQRSAETLVIGELLDRTARLREDNRPVTVLDIAMEQTRGRDWVFSKVAVRRENQRRGLSRRRGEMIVVGWDMITGLAATEERQGAANMLAAFDALRPADLASVLHDLSAKRRLEVASALADERLADVLEELPDEDQVEIVGQLGSARAAQVLEEMDPDDAADLLAEVPREHREQLLELMQPDDAEPVRRLLKYPEQTAGGMMTTEPVVLSPDATIAEALASVRNPDLSPALASQVYVCRPPTETPTGHYLGTVHIQRLLREPPSTLIGEVIDRELDPLRPRIALRSLSGYLATYNLVAAPIVDDDGRLLGAVTVDDVLDHLLPANWRDDLHLDEELGDVRSGEAEPTGAGAAGKDTNEH